jgi:hypothetical protein
VVKLRISSRVPVVKLRQCKLVIGPPLRVQRPLETRPPGGPQFGG